jgi:hypothetical protein
VGEELEPKSYYTKKFGIKKEVLEKRKVSETIYEGGWFGLTHTSIFTHNDRFFPIHLGKYPFVAIERDEETFEDMATQMIDMAGALHCFDSTQQEDFDKFELIKLLKGDLFDELFRAYPKTAFSQKERRTFRSGYLVYRKPMFTYGHLDFCCSAVKLTDEKLEYNLRRLAKWWALTEVFHLDITVSRRGDKKDATSNILLDHIIPNTFRQLNWTQINRWKENYRDKDSAAMTTAFYIFRKELSKNKHFEE